MIPRALILPAVILLAAMAACGGGTGGSSNNTTSVNAGLPVQHVVVVVFENQDYTDVVGSASMPYWNRLAAIERGDSDQ